jgi:galactose mutarotase-like enzyme
MLPSGDQIELRHGDQRAVVVEVGGALRAYEAGGRALLDGYAEDEMCPSARGQALIPWPNRLRDGSYRFDGEELQLPLTEPGSHNAIHGLVRWEPWTAGDRAPGRVRMEHVLHPRDGYPFTLQLAIEYALGDDGLTVRTTATNTGTRRAPYGAGAHPYLTAGTPVIDPCELRAPGAVRMLTDDRGIPTGEEPVDGTPYDFREPRTLGGLELDTGFAQLQRDADGRARVRLAAPEGGPAVTLWQDEGYAYLMLFTGDSLPDASRRRGGLGVEPMTCAPNAFASGDGLRVLEPGERFSATWGITPG